MSRNHDLTILGGGLAGLSLALQCRRQLPNATICVLEKRPHPAPEAAFKVGESTVEAAAFYFGEMLGLRTHIVGDQLPKLGLRFFFPADDNSQIERRLELGGKRYAPCPSYQLDRGRFENFLAEHCRERGIEFLDRAEVSDVHINRRGKPHRVEAKIDGEREQIQTRWVVDASGRRALLKRKLGLQKDSPHVANAAWFRISQPIKIDEWSGDPNWQDGHSAENPRWYSTNHLMGQGYWVWLIPLASGSTSVGIVAAEEFHKLSEFNSLEKSIAWLEKHEPQCARVVTEHLDSVQDFRAIKHYSTECRQVFSANRWGITGEAGFFHDPFYSPGSDFIAFSNTFLTDLIARDLQGRGHRIRAYTYDRIYKRFYYGTLTAYRHQYQLFGNPNVMPVKILWDYLVYWSITAFIFMQGRACHQTLYLRNLGRLNRFSKLNHWMQAFFRDWHTATQASPLRGGVVDISRIPLIRETNATLLESLDDKTFRRRFAANLDQMETLAREIVEASGLGVSVPFPRSRSSLIHRGAFESVFSTLQANPADGPQDHESVSAA